MALGVLKPVHETPLAIYAQHQAQANGIFTQGTVIPVPCETISLVIFLMITVCHVTLCPLLKLLTDVLLSTQTMIFFPTLTVTISQYYMRYHINHVQTSCIKVPHQRLCKRSNMRSWGVRVCCLCLLSTWHHYYIEYYHALLHLYFELKLRACFTEAKFEYKWLLL